VLRREQVFVKQSLTAGIPKLELGNETRAAPFNDGVFSTIYLSPKDYHRLHVPLTGTLTEKLIIM
jgi:phosphatidylserine decarboxylase